MAAGVFGLHMLAFVFGADHVMRISELDVIGVGVAIGLLKAAMLWLGYVPLEPIVRRRLPHGLISWTRLTSEAHDAVTLGHDLTGQKAAFAGRGVRRR